MSDTNDKSPSTMKQHLQSEGFAHATKDQVNITTSKKEILYDHFWIKGVE